MDIFTKYSSGDRVLYKRMIPATVCDIHVHVYTIPPQNNLIIHTTYDILFDEPQVTIEKVWMTLTTHYERRRTHTSEHVYENELIPLERTIESTRPEYV